MFHIFSVEEQIFPLFKNNTVFLYGPDIRWHMGTWLSHNWPKNSLVTLALWMNCAAAVIMQLLSPQDWLDGIQAAFLVITIFPMFATLFVTPSSKTYVHFPKTLSKFNGAVAVWQFKACEDRSVGGALYICPLWEIISDVSHKISRRRVEIWQNMVDVT